MFLGVKRNLKDYKLWDSENKKIVLSRYVKFYEALLLKFFISQQAERMKTKDISQWVEIDATPPFFGCSILVGISLVVTSVRDYVVVLDAEHVDYSERNQVKFTKVSE